MPRHGVSADTTTRSPSTNGQVDSDIEAGLSGSEPSVRGASNRRIILGERFHVVLVSVGISVRLRPNRAERLLAFSLRDHSGTRSGVCNRSAGARRLIAALAGTVKPVVYSAGGFAVGQPRVLKGLRVTANVEAWGASGLQYELTDGVAWLRLNHPEKRNAIDRPMAWPG